MAGAAATARGGTAAARGRRPAPADRDSERPSPHHGADLATDRLRVWLQMLKAVRFVEGRLRERLRAEHGMTLPRFDVLATLYGLPDGLRMGDLSKQLVVSNGNVTGVVDRLVAEGLLRRDTAEADRRSIVVRLTPEGRALMGEVIGRHRVWVDELLGGVDEADCARAIAVMLAIRDKRRTPRR